MADAAKSVVDLYHNANDGISFYYYIKNIENKLNCNSKFLYCPFLEYSTTIL